MVMSGLDPKLNEKNTKGGWSEEEYLLGHDKYRSNMYPSNHGDLLESSSDKDVPHKRIRMLGT